VSAVAPGAATPIGKVVFMDGNVVLGTVGTDANGTATFTTSFATAGSHVITAVFPGGVLSFLASSQTLTEQVNAPSTHKSTTTALVASANPARVGHAVTFTATVRGPAGAGTPTGTVTFFVGNQAVLVMLDANGQARFTHTFPSTGRFTIRAVYSGDASFDASSQPLTEQVNR
jgi:hypothetical protein